MAFTNYNGYASGFAALGSAIDDFSRANDARDLKNGLAMLGAGISDPNADYRALAGKAISMGQPGLAESFLRMGETQASEVATRNAGASIGGMVSGRPQPGSIAALGVPLTTPAQPTGTGPISALGSSAPAQPAFPGGPQFPASNKPSDPVITAATPDEVEKAEISTGMRPAPRPQALGAGTGAITPAEDLAIRTTIGEAKGQGDIGLKAVAAVIRNRSLGSGKSFGDVVLAPNQFEPWSSRRGELLGYDRNGPDYQRTAAAILPVLRGEEEDPTGGATHFYAPRAQAALGRARPAWDNGSGTDIGDHRFFRLGYGGQGRDGIGGAPRPTVTASAPTGSSPIASVAPVFYTDSLGVGATEAMGFKAAGQPGQRLGSAPGYQRESASPQEVYAKINTAPPADAPGQPMFISAISNNVQQGMAGLPAVLKNAADKGYSPVVLGVGPRFASLNVPLQKMVEANGGTFIPFPTGQAAPDGVHMTPDGYQQVVASLGSRRPSAGQPAAPGDDAPIDLPRTLAEARGQPAQPGPPRGQPVDDYGAPAGSPDPEVKVPGYDGTWTRARAAQAKARDPNGESDEDYPAPKEIKDAQGLQFPAPVGPSAAAPAPAAQPAGTPAASPDAAPAKPGGRTWRTAGEVPQQLQDGMANWSVPDLVGIMANPRVAAGMKDVAKSMLALKLNESKVPEKFKEFTWARANGLTSATTIDEWDARGKDKETAGEKVTSVTDARIKVATEKLGLQPGTPEYNSYVGTGKLPDQAKAGEMKATEQKMFAANTEKAATLERQIADLEKAKELNPLAYSGNYGPQAAQFINRNLPAAMANTIVDPKRATATTQFKNLVDSATLSQGKELFGARITNYDEKLLQDLKARPDMTPAERATIIDQFIAVRKQVLAEVQDTLRQQKTGTFFRRSPTGQAVEAAPGAPAPRPASLPPQQPQPGQPSLAQGPTAAPPPGAIQMLRDDPSLRSAFDEKYGQGAAAIVLGQ